MKGIYCFITNLFTFICIHIRTNIVSCLSLHSIPRAAACKQHQGQLIFGLPRTLKEGLGFAQQEGAGSILPTAENRGSHSGRSPGAQHCQLG